MSEERVTAGAIRKHFAHGRSKPITIVPRKPVDRLAAHPARQAALPLVRKGGMAQRAIKVPSTSAPRGTTVTLNRECPSATLLAGGYHQSRIVVKGCGAVPTQLPLRKRVFVEMMAAGKVKRLMATGITCDGEAVLPKRVIRVRLELKQLDAEIVVTVEQRPAGSRKKYGPKRWLVRRTERPVRGGVRRPKPLI